MDIPREIDDFIKESIDDSLGLPISTNVLQQKLRVAEESQRRLRDQYLLSVSRLKEKDQLIDRARAEASLNAQALKKFVEENKKLADECGDLLNQCKKWERECLLYHQDREALMEFGNEADERAREAETRVQELEEELGKMSDELKSYVLHPQPREVDSSEVPSPEERMLDSVLSTLISMDEVPSGRAILEANSQVRACGQLLHMWNCLRPSTQKVLSMVSGIKKLEREKECLILNLSRAEEEVQLVTKHNQQLGKEKRRLLRQLQKNCSPRGSSGKLSESLSTKSNKRKSSPKMMTSPIQKKIDFSSLEEPREPLSPLRHNSPDVTMHKN